jgi:tRNA(Arg) A34 adenosine deaminase TadA
MCLGAIYWARPDRVFYACTREDAAAIGFDDAFIYREIDLPVAARSIPMASFEREKALAVFRAWMEKEDKIAY